MPRGDPPATDKQKRQGRVTGKGHAQTGTARPEAAARAWAAADKLHGGGKKVASRRNLPSGPLGGSGRKTNRARSS